MAAAKGLYDPVKAIEGMFNGSVTRIAYALKDPVGYSGSTKTVLAECAKRFHDALDDCEIQLLDAKWFLEHQLRNNHLRREAQARELGTTAKRKHNEISDAHDATAAEEAAAKKVKVDSKQKDSKERVQTNDLTIEPKVEAKGGATISKVAEQPQKLKLEKDEKKQPNNPPQKMPSTQPVIPPEPPKPEVKEQQPQPTADDFANPTPQATPAGTNDDFPFESMFVESNNDTMEDPDKDNIDLDFDFTTGDFGTEKDGQEDQEPPSLDTLLPGLESYANQTDDNILTNPNPGMNTNTINNTSNSNVQDVDALPSFSNDFDKPNPGGPNIFDDFFNDDGLVGADGSGGNFVDNIDLSDQAFLDLDLEGFQ